MSPLEFFKVRCQVEPKRLFGNQGKSQKKSTPKRVDCTVKATRNGANESDQPKRIASLYIRREMFANSASSILILPALAILSRTESM